VPKKVDPEKIAENDFVKHCESLGYLCLKLRIDGLDGWPDRTVITPQGVFFVEFKSATGDLRPHQRKWKRLLEAMGYTVCVARTLTEALHALRTYK